MLIFLFQDAEKFNRLVAAPTAIIARDIIVSSKHSISAHAHLVPTWWGSEVDGSRWRRAQTPLPKRVWYLTSEFLVVLSQHVRKTGSPIRLLDLLKSCDMKEN